MTRISKSDFDKSTALAAHSRRSKAVARALDQQGPALPFSRVFTSLEFEDFLGQLTPRRFELLRLASRGRQSIADLAAASQRDQAAVSRDVSKLTALGLLKVEQVPNVGHGLKKIVSPVARTISIQTSIEAS